MQESGWTALTREQSPKASPSGNIHTATRKKETKKKPVRLV
jgi:hypothetical protein